MLNPLILISADTILNLPTMIFPGKEEETLDTQHMARRLDTPLATPLGTPLAMDQRPGQGTLVRIPGTHSMTWGIRSTGMIMGSRTRAMQRTMDTQVIRTLIVSPLGPGQRIIDLQQGVLPQPSQDTIVNSMRY